MNEFRRGPARSSVHIRLERVDGGFAGVLGDLHYLRMQFFDSLEQVESFLAELAKGESPLVRVLPARPGQKDRYVQLLSGEPVLAGDFPTEPVLAGAIEMLRSGEPTRLETLEKEVETLKAELHQLREELLSFRKQFE